MYFILPPTEIRPKMSTDEKCLQKDKTGDKDKNKVDLGLLEEDDEFEEFPTEGKGNSEYFPFCKVMRLEWFHHSIKFHSIIAQLEFSLNFLNWTELEVNYYKFCTTQVNLNCTYLSCSVYLYVAYSWMNNSNNLESQ